MQQDVGVEARLRSPRLFVVRIGHNPTAQKQDLCRCTHHTFAVHHSGLLNHVAAVAICCERVGAILEQERHQVCRPGTRRLHQCRASVVRAAHPLNVGAGR